MNDTESTTTTTTTSPSKAPRKPRVTRRTPAPVLAGPAAVRHDDGRVMALTPSTYPEVEDAVELWCVGHLTLHPAKAFSFNVKRGSGDGRATECRRAWADRLAASKELRAAGKPPLPVPHVDEEHVLPKAPRAATVEK